MPTRGQLWWRSLSDEERQQRKARLIEQDEERRRQERWAVLTPDQERIAWMARDLSIPFDPAWVCLFYGNGTMSPQCVRERHGQDWGPPPW